MDQEHTGRIIYLVWECLGASKEELENVARERDVSGALLPPGSRRPQKRGRDAMDGLYYYRKAL